MGDNKKQKPLIYYYIMTLLVIMFINTYVVPNFFSPKVNELPYGTFIQMVDEDKFSKVEITDKRIAALGKGADEQQIYVTGRVDDPQLVERLMKSKVEFSQVVPKEDTFIVSFFKAFTSLRLNVHLSIALTKSHSIASAHTITHETHKELS